MPDSLFDDSRLMQMWEEFAQQYCSESLAVLEANYPTKRSLVINYGDVQKFNGELADFLLEKPDLALPAFEKVLKRPNAGVMEIEFAPHVRLAGLPGEGLLVQDVSSSHIDKMISLKGIVTKRAEVMHKVRIALYKCLMCEHIMRVPITRHMVPPEVCTECKRRSLKLDEEGSYFVDIQRAEFQELLERLKGGAPASKLEIMMEDDLVNVVAPGESLEIVGIVRLKQPKAQKGNKDTIASSIYGRYIEVNNIVSLKRDFEEITISADEERQILALSKEKGIYEKIQKAVAPGIYGRDEVKMAIVFQMFGGTKNKTMPGGAKIRDDVHVLLIGDPGSAKTRMLQYAKDLVPKGIFVSGKSATGAGLTAAAEKDEMGDGGWTLKAGALVLASGGLAAIDEFDKMDESERSSMHEAMESQTVSVAKAGIVATFRTKCAILAAANPKFGRFDRNRLPGEQFDIPPTILSRFDLIFVIYDILDKVEDSRMAEKILNAHRNPEDDKPKPDEISRDLLTKYIAYMRRNCNPMLSEDAAEKIKEYYVDLRVRGAEQGAVPITPRQIEGIIRLTEASAKVRNSPVAQKEDADRAIALMNFMQDQILRDKETGAIDVDIAYTGKPKSQVDKINNIFAIAKELQGKYDMVEINKIVEEAQKHNISEIDARRFLDELIYKGDLYKVRHGYVKVTENYG